MNEDVFGRYSGYYDLLYRDKNYIAEAEYVVHSLRLAIPDVRTVLEFGSGTGRHGRLLAKHGLDVFGIERSGTMVSSATHQVFGNPTREGGKFDCQQGDIRTVKLDRTFDAVIALFHVMSYQTTNADLLLTFANAARHLRDGGVFLFDVWHGPAVLFERPSVRVKRVEDAATRLTRLAEPELDTNSSVVTVRYTMLAESKETGQLTTFYEEHPMRYLFPTEIHALAEQSGFEIERMEEYLSGKKPSVGTWGLAYLLRKASARGPF